MRQNSNLLQDQKLLAGGSVSQALLERTVAFLNSDGGHVTLDTHGMTTDSSTLHTALCSEIRPNPAQLIRVDMMPGGRVDVRVTPGTRTPYYIRDRGICPRGVYVQRSGRAIPAGALEILRMNRAAHGKAFEDMRSLRQDLTFQEAAAVALQRGMELEPSDFAEFGIRNPEDGEYSNLGFLLSDQCPHAIRAARFQEREKAESKGSRYIGGSMLRQIELGLKYVGTLETRSTHPDMEPMMATSTEDRELQFPAGAVQTALLHAVTHRDYSIVGSMFIDVYDSGIEIFTPGGLLEDLTLKESLRRKDIQPRNPKLIHLLQHLQFIGEKVPHVGDVLPLYAGEEEQPSINIMQYSFAVYLPTLARGNHRSDTQSEGVQM